MVQECMQHLRCIVQHVLDLQRVPAGLKPASAAWLNLYDDAPVGLAAWNTESGMWVSLRCESCCQPSDDRDSNRVSVPRLARLWA